jgi:hypothetical protein
MRTHLRFEAHKYKIGSEQNHIEYPMVKLGWCAFAQNTADFCAIGA